MKIHRIYSDWGIIINYVIAFLSILLAIICKQHWIILLPVLYFLIHDITFRIDKKGCNFEGRDYKTTVESVRAASNYISYFIALIGVFVGILISSDKMIPVLDLMKNDAWIKVYGFIVITLSGVALLFVPVQYKQIGENNERPTEALKNCFFAVLFFEKVIILFLIYILIVFAKKLVI